jgi:hypothetical protein
LHGCVHAVEVRRPRVKALARACTLNSATPPMSARLYRRPQVYVDGSHTPHAVAFDTVLTLGSLSPPPPPPPPFRRRRRPPSPLFATSMFESGAVPLLLSKNFTLVAACPEIHPCCFQGGCPLLPYPALQPSRGIHDIPSPLAGPFSPPSGREAGSPTDDPAHNCPTAGPFSPSPSRLRLGVAWLGSLRVRAVAIGT